jgi:RNA polymerase sigma factor (TIGR02999 family)
MNHDPLPMPITFGGSGAASPASAITEPLMGDSIDDLFEKFHGEILALARALLARERAMVSTVTLVSELYLKLQSREDLRFAKLEQFMAYLSRTMRSHLVDEARKRIAQKRSAELVPLTLGIEVSDGGATPEKILELDQLVEGLGQDHPRLYKVAEMRIFMVMTVSEIAAALQVAEPTIKRDWQIIKAYMMDALGKEP